MRAAALDAFLREQVARAKADDVLFSVHLKATMMKVSDPIVFGHVVRAFLPEVFERYGDDLAAAGLSPNNGLGSILDGLSALPNGDEIKAAVDAGSLPVRAWRWSTPTRGSPTSTSRATSSSTPPCPR